ncbi:MAG: hypothetical protein ABI282_10910 [Candidatus Baltobacteraceae bacterium]
MKLPYRNGTWHELPLGDGSFAVMCIMRVDRHCVDIAAYADTSASPVAVLRVSDRALVLHRWHAIDARGSVPDLPTENATWVGPARAERIVASRLGRIPFKESAIEVRDLRNGVTPSGSLLTWREPLDPATLREVETYVRRHQNVSVRLYGTAVRQLDALATWPLRHLRLAGEPGRARIESVRELHLEADTDVGAALQCFPNVSALRIAVRNLRFDAGSIGGAGIALLDCSGLRCVVHLRALPALRALRLARIVDEPDLDGLNVTALSIDDVGIASLGPIEAMPALEQLELRGLWQLRIGDVEPALTHANLVRGFVDIGGRRKNIEIYRRARWAYPWPFPLRGEVSGATL